MTRVVLIHNMVAPYRVPLFNAIAEDPRVDLRLLLMAATESNRAWPFPRDLRVPYEILRGWHLALRRGQFTLHVNPGILRAIREHDPDAVVLGGYDSATTFLAVLAARLRRRKRLVLWSETSGLHRPSDEGWRAMPKAWFIRRMDAALVPGKSAAAYLRRFARRDLPCETFPNVVQTDWFRLDPERRATLRADSRRRMGIEGLAILFSGRMVATKGLHDLLACYDRAELRVPSTLVLLGQGEMHDDALRLAETLQGPKRVVLLPFRPMEQLAEVYAAADVLVLPSREEPWGFVVQEAMLARLPALVSDVVGCAADLVVEGETGWSFPAGDREALRRAIERLPQTDLEAAGACAQARALEYGSVARSVEAFVHAVDDSTVAGRAR